MGKFSDVFKYARNNDVKAINKSIRDVSREHHAVYMTNMMFTNDINANYQLLSEIQDAVNSFYRAVSDNCLTKRNAQIALQTEYKNETILKRYFEIINNEQLLTLVYQQAMEYYFRIDIKGEFGLGSYFDEAVKYRIASSFLQSDMRCILTKMYEDIEIVIEDTKNVDFLMKNYKKIEKSNNLFQYILDQLADSLRNVVLQDNKFDDGYFATVRRISFELQQFFYGGQIHNG